jgi:phosphoenolpyruvate carboxykinase (ATP)
MAKIQRGDLRGANTYEKGRLGTKEIIKAEGQGLDDWDAKKFYSEGQIETYIHDLVEGRRAYTEEIAGEGLRDEILYAAERSYRIDKSAQRTRISVPGAPETEEEEGAAPSLPSMFKSRPRRDGFRRSR